MMLPLIKKEIKEHALAFSALLLLVSSFTLVVFHAAARQDVGSFLEPFGAFLLVSMPLGAALVAFRLVSRDHAQQTQLFLEALPTTRVRIAAAKCITGLFVLLVVFSAALGLALWEASFHEVLTLHFVGILVIRLFSFLFLVYTFFFVLSHLGRYRFPALLSVLVVLTLVDGLTRIELYRAGPFMLVAERFAYERSVLPTDVVAGTLLLSSAFLLLGFVLAVAGEGSVSALLARKMSHGEKVFFAVLFTGALAGLAVLDAKQARPPFVLHDSFAEEGDGISIQFAPGHAGTEEGAKRLVKFIHEEMKELREYLGIEEFPPLFIINRKDLDPDKYERGEIEDADGILVRIHYSPGHWDLDAFIAWLVREIVIESSHGRAEIEPRRWILDGFGRYWISRPTVSTPLFDDQKKTVCALCGTKRGIARKDLDAWLTFREKVGKDVAESIAFKGLKMLSEASGDEQTRSFLKAALGGNAPEDARASIQRLLHPLPSQLKANTGIEYDEFIEQWSNTLEEEQRRRQGEVHAMPVVQGELSFDRVSKVTRKVRYRAQISPETPAGARCSFLYAEIDSFSREIKAADVHSEELDCRSMAQGAELPGAFSKGSRLGWTFSLKLPEVDCEVISGWVRQEIP